MSKVIIEYEEGTAQLTNIKGSGVYRGTCWKCGAPDLNFSEKNLVLHCFGCGESWAVTESKDTDQRFLI